MSDVVIKVENLSKKYIIGHQRQERYTALRDVMAEGAKNFARKLLHPFNSSTGQRFNDSTEEFYALRDVSFEIKRGDRVGIIGRNGAGKSTLLKILSRITEPTSGRIEIDGRVASLLEVGTGFHPELTGRENIFLNGAILGMTREEIKRKFDEIVAFAEIEKFLDTPVKRYSSGMYVRLAFAVAAHLEPEILIVDEVLAVGDAQFQKKCLGKMEEVGKEGRTVLFVSHNMGSIQSLCEKALFVDSGVVKAVGNVAEIIDMYIHDNSRLCKKMVRDRTDRSGSGDIRIVNTEIYSKHTGGCRLVKGPGHKIVEIDYEIMTETKCNNVNVAVGIDDSLGNRIVTLWSKYNNFIYNDIPRIGTFVCEMPQLNIRTGTYFMHVYMEANGKISDYVHNSCEFTVEYTKYYLSGLEPVGDQGCIMIEHDWKIVKSDNAYNLNRVK